MWSLFCNSSSRLLLVPRKGCALILCHSLDTFIYIFGMVSRTTTEAGRNYGSGEGN